MDFFVDLHGNASKISEISSYPVQTEKVMLYGSSFFTNWRYEQAARQLSEASGGKLEVINHGFGGATIDELLYWYDRLVKPYKPRMMVFRTGYNELARGQTPEGAVFLLERLLQWATVDNPGVRLVILKVFDTRHASEELFEKFKIYNTLLEERFAGQENVSVVDITPFFYEDAADIGTRQNFREVFVADGLHLTDGAYEEMAVYLAKILMEKLEA